MEDKVINGWSLKKMVKKIILCVLLAILSFSLIGCQAMAGLGNDIEWSAEATSDLLEGDYE